MNESRCHRQTVRPPPRVQSSAVSSSNNTTSNNSPSLSHPHVSSSSALDITSPTLKRRPNDHLKDKIPQISRLPHSSHASHISHSHHHSHASHGSHASHASHVSHVSHGTHSSHLGVGPSSASAAGTTWSVPDNIETPRVISKTEWEQEAEAIEKKHGYFLALGQQEASHHQTAQARIQHLVSSQSSPPTDSERQSIQKAQMKANYHRKQHQVLKQFSECHADFFKYRMRCNKLLRSEDLQSNKILKFVLGLTDLFTREACLWHLSKKREDFPDLAPLLWSTPGVIAALMQEVIGVYPYLDGMRQMTNSRATRCCNSLALLQCVASHPETRGKFLKCYIPFFLYPFLNIKVKDMTFEFLRLTSLGVIGALVKAPQPKPTAEDLRGGKMVSDKEVFEFLVTTEAIPLCLHIMEHGNELSKTVATFIVQRILCDEFGLNYICKTSERFYAVISVMRRCTTDQLSKASDSKDDANPTNASTSANGEANTDSSNNNSANSSKNTSASGAKNEKNDGSSASNGVKTNKSKGEKKENEKPNARLLRHIIRCYLRFCEDKRAWMALPQVFPDVLREKSVDRLFEMDTEALEWLQKLRKKVSESIQRHQNRSHASHASHASHTSSHASHAHASHASRSHSHSHAAHGSHGSHGSHGTHGTHGSSSASSHSLHSQQSHHTHRSTASYHGSSGSRSNANAAAGADTSRGASSGSRHASQSSRSHASHATAHGSDAAAAAAAAAARQQQRELARQQQIELQKQQQKQQKQQQRHLRSGGTLQQQQHQQLRAPSSTGTAGPSPGPSGVTGGAAAATAAGASSGAVGGVGGVGQGYGMMSGVASNGVHSQGAVSQQGGQGQQAQAQTQQQQQAQQAQLQQQYVQGMMQRSHHTQQRYMHR